MEYKIFNHRNPYHGAGENVSSDTETIQGLALSIPALLQRAQLGTVDPSGFFRTGDYDASTQNDDDYEPAPTFGSSFAEAEEYISGVHERAKRQVVSASPEEHSEKPQEEPDPQKSEEQLPQEE